MKVAELEGRALDYWVAKAEGLPLSESWNCAAADGILVGTGAGDLELFSPSTSWEFGGPIIEAEKFYLEWDADGYWVAATPHSAQYRATTPLVAAMRAFVADKFGDTVPDEVRK
jgi:hypothetical protein